jgi:hypothetical protein
VRELIVEDPAPERDDHDEATLPITTFVASSAPQAGQTAGQRRSGRDACERCGRFNHNQSRCWQHRHIDGKTLSDPPPLTRPGNQAQSNTVNNLQKTRNWRESNRLHQNQELCSQRVTR